jgi:hypothetical protein
MSVAELREAVAAGASFVCFQFCISCLVLSFKRSSPIILVRAGESAVAKGWSYSLISLFAGWWGIPWGPIWTLMTVAQNLSGGTDLTAPVMAALGVAAVPPVAPEPLSPTQAAEREERESRKTLIRRLAWGVVALFILFGVYGVYKVAQAGSRLSKRPGEAHFRSATSQLGTGRPTASGNGAAATRLAAGMSQLMKQERERNFAATERKSSLDASDEFRTYCHLQSGQCVFLIHVPELRRFTEAAKQELGEAAWFYAVGLLGKSSDRLRLAVALRGIATYDRVLTGEFAPKGTEKWAVKPSLSTGLEAERVLMPWFPPPPADANPATPAPVPATGSSNSTLKDG